MSRTFNPIAGTGAGSAYQVADPFGFQTAEKLRNDLNLLALGCFGRNQYMGGDVTFGLDGSAAATVDLAPALPFLIDNASSQISGSANIVVQVRFLVRVSNAAISVTPKIYDLTAAALATVSGNAACSATNADFSGTNQQQTVTLTLAAGAHSYKPQLTVAGTPAAGYQVWGVALVDIYVAG